MKEYNTVMGHLALTALLLTCVVIQDISAFGSGPPSGACGMFKPTGHGVDPQGANSNPFEITVSKTSFSADETIEVTLRSTDSSNFKGFLIVARSVTYDSNDIEASAVGSFALETDTKQNCGNKALSHSTQLSVNSISLQWTAPSSAVGDIVFQATVVQQKVTYWTEVLSEELTDGAVITEDPNATDPPTTTAPPNVDFTIDLSLCGSTKGCFRRPSGCASTDCTVAATWSRPADASYVEVELVGKQDGWVALGFSEDNQMDSDYVLRCIRNGDVVSVQNSFNSDAGKFNQAFEDGSLGISEQKTAYSDGVLKCSFRRSIVLPSTRRKRQTSDDEWFFDLENEYSLLLGYGPASSGALSQHEETPVISSEKVTVTTDTADIGANLILLKVHGILMILAWIIMIDVSLLIARFYKDAWPDRKIAGKQPWFPVHVCLNILAVLFTATAFVIIFVDIGGLSQFSADAETTHKAHPIIGIIITCLAIINPIMAIFRCTPDDPKRGIFNWFHWAVGIVAQILAITNVFFGIGLDRSKSFTPDWVLWVLVAFVVVHGLIVITLELHRCYLHNRNKKGGQEMEMKAARDKSGEQIFFGSPQRGLGFKYAVLAFYVLSVMGCGLAVIIGIGLSK